MYCEGSIGNKEHCHMNYSTLYSCRLICANATTGADARLSR